MRGKTIKQCITGSTDIFLRWIRQHGGNSPLLGNFRKFQTTAATLYSLAAGCCGRKEKREGERERKRSRKIFKTRCILRSFAPINSTNSELFTSVFEHRQSGLDFLRLTNTAECCRTLSASGKSIKPKKFLPFTTLFFKNIFIITRDSHVSFNLLIPRSISVYLI